jgi:hypothetical protein
MQARLLYRLRRVRSVVLHEYGIYLQRRIDPTVVVYQQRTIDYCQNYGEL